jgi:hypothetical protein
MVTGRTGKTSPEELGLSGGASESLPTPFPTGQSLIGTTRRGKPMRKQPGPEATDMETEENPGLDTVDPRILQTNDQNLSLTNYARLTEPLISAWVRAWKSQA